MKKAIHLFRKLTPAILLLSLCLTMLGLGMSQAAAEGPAQNDVPAIAEILKTGAQRYIQLPDESSCLSSFKTRYIDRLEYDWCTATVIDDIDDLKDYQKACGPAVPVEKLPQLRTGRRHMPWAYEGSKVTVVAEENDMSCILYYSSDNTPQAGWVQNRFLVDEFPGEVLTVGQADRTETAVINDASVTWSRKGFLDSLQNYSVLEEPMRNCVGFTLDYQLIAENTNNWSAIFGPRTIYIHNGEEWIRAGSFDYPKHGTVKVFVSLEEPTDITAVGTIAEVSLPNTFRFRQFLSDFLIAQ